MTRKTRTILGVIGGGLLSLVLIGFVLRMIAAVQSGRGADIYMSMKGIKTTPISVLVLLAVVPIVLVVAYAVEWLQRRKDFVPHVKGGKRLRADRWPNPPGQGAEARL
jgi:hypothetical protein